MKKVGRFDVNGENESRCRSALFEARQAGDDHIAEVCTEILEDECETAS